MKVSLVIMAAGLGSRYGGSKQVDGIGPHNEILMEYSIYDALRAGFSKVVFIIKPEMEEMMHRICGDYLAKKTALDGSPVEVAYAFQDFSSVPDFYHIPPERTKPFGTVHALLCAADVVHEPCCVINADDYYGPEAFKVIYEYLSTHQDGAVYDYCMVSYLLKNTVSENGTVSRGVCVVNPDGTLHSVTERTGIETYEGGIRCTSLTGEGTDDLPVEAPVSMNLWGFGKSFLDEADRRFAGWLRENLPKNPLKCEYFLPTVASELIDEGKAAVTVLKSTDKWYGVTYREDKPTVVAAIAQKTQEGLYPEDLWA